MQQIYIPQQYQQQQYQQQMPLQVISPQPPMVGQSMPLPPVEMYQQCPPPVEIVQPPMEYVQLPPGQMFPGPVETVELVQQIQPVQLVEEIQRVQILQPAPIEVVQLQQVCPVDIIQRRQPPPLPLLEDAHALNQLVNRLEYVLARFDRPPEVIERVHEVIREVPVLIPPPPPPPPPPTPQLIPIVQPTAMIPFPAARPGFTRLPSCSTGHLPMVGSDDIIVNVTTTTMQYPNGDYYVGQVDVVTGLPHGEGKYTWAAGSMYKGSWRMGFKEGYGVYEEEDGYEYRGGWKKSEKCGFGVEKGTTLDGRTYSHEGGFSRNQRHGVGTKNGYIRVKYKHGKRDDDCIIM